MPQTRKLAAILSADVFGYSRLMSEDEQATVAALHESKEVMARRVAGQSGRVVDSTGDALLAEFPSALAAVSAAVEVQRELAERNAQRPEARRMLWRIGINLGDVIDEGGILYGDGVNIAARLQALASPGGVCVSATVFEQVEGKLPVMFRSGGEQPVKNYPKPVRVFHAALKGGGCSPKRAAQQVWRAAIAGDGGVALAGVGWLAGSRGRRSGRQPPGCEALTARSDPGDANEHASTGKDVSGSTQSGPPLSSTGSAISGASTRPSGPATCKASRRRATASPSDGPNAILDHR